MVWLTFSFLLGIPSAEDEKKRSRSVRTDEKYQGGINHVIIEVSKANFQCHIEYVLVPNEPPQGIDVVCWNQAAKIYFQDSTAAIIPLKMEKLRWIHFRVNHRINLELHEIPNFHSHVIKFTVYLDNKKFGEAAKFDKPKKFYGPGKPKGSANIRQQIFQPLSEELENLLSVSYFKEHLTSKQNLYIALDTTIETGRFYSKLFKKIYASSDEYHKKNFVRTPYFEEVEPPLVDIIQPINVSESHEEKTGKEGKSQQRNADKKVSTKTKEPEKIEFSITGEQILSGHHFIEKSVKYGSEELPYIHFLVSVKQPMNKAQIKHFRPLSVVVSKLRYLPVDQLKRDGVTKLKLRFLICNQFLAESNLIPLDKNLRINHVRTILTNTIDKAKLMYFIQTTGLNVDLLASLPKSSTDTSTASEGNQGREKEPDKNLVLLGRASADISSILLKPYTVSLECDVTMSNVSCERENNNEFTSILEFNSSPQGVGRVYNLLKDSRPTLKLFVGLGKSLTNVWKEVTLNPNLFNRIFIVFHNVEMALPVVQIIQNEIEGVLGLVDYLKIVKNLKKPLLEKCVEDMETFDSSKDVDLTGFIIDCIDKVLIYAESPQFGGIQKIWASVSCISQHHGHVLYDSSLIFLDRLYSNFIELGGFLGLSLKESPEIVLTTPQSYSKQSIPRPAWKALRCLSLLTTCKSIKSAVRNNIFPDYRCLVSLALEFGTPIQLCALTGRKSGSYL